MAATEIVLRVSCRTRLSSCADWGFWLCTVKFETGREGKLWVSERETKLQCKEIGMRVEEEREIGMRSDGTSSPETARALRRR
ncbi:unnamed protein product [Linum trigynum]|uniref:Uncharacterized protein n=1 Tax=Linum trigynum TaxID=586398 RepID=A0AAV2CPA9_9ROSI